MAKVFTFSQLPHRMNRLGNHMGGPAIDRKVKDAATIFGSVVVDVVAEAAFIEKDAKVKIVEIHGNRVVVRAVN